MSTSPEDNSEAFFQSFIDPELWDQAKWHATLFIGASDDSEPPILGIVFKNITAGRKVFEQWIDRLGTLDAYEELRISIVEGDIPNQEPGYSVLVTANLPNIIARLEKIKPEFKPTHFMVLSRMHRMNPAPGSPHLPNFKRVYGIHRRFLLIPAEIDMKTMQATPHLDLAIEKREINFLDAPSIGKNDPEAALFASNLTKG